MTSAERTRKWRAMNPERDKANNARWRKNNPEKKRAQTERCLARYPGLKDKYNRECNERDIARYIFRQCKGRAKSIGREFLLTYSWVAEKVNAGVCARTNLPFIFEIGNKKVYKAWKCSPFFPSIDRIDSKLGYTETNCQVVCVMYNMAKNQWTDAEVLKFARGLAKYNEMDPLA